MEAIEICLRAIDKQLRFDSIKIEAILKNQADQDRKIDDILIRLDAIEKKRIRSTP